MLLFDLLNPPLVSLHFCTEVVRAQFALAASANSGPLTFGGSAPSACAPVFGDLAPSGQFLKLSKTSSVSSSSFSRSSSTSPSSTCSSPSATVLKASGLLLDLCRGVVADRRLVRCDIRSFFKHLSVDFVEDGGSHLHLQYLRFLLELVLSNPILSIGGKRRGVDYLRTGTILKAFRTHAVLHSKQTAVQGI